MNASVTETAGDTAKSAIDALKSTPVILALVIFNCLYMGLGAWQNYKDTETRTEMVQTWSKEHMDTAKMLASCMPVVPGVPPQFKLQSDESKPVELPPAKAFDIPQ